MMKDYIPANQVVSSLSETAFVEDYWSQKWDALGLPVEGSAQIEQKDEFKLMQPFLHFLPGGSRLLDAGCGLGEWTLYFARQGFHVTGMDLSQATIAKLKERFPERDFIAGDIRQTVFDESTFDAIYSWGVFEHFEAGLGAPLAEARRILKQGGYLFLSVPYQNGRHTRNMRQPLYKLDKSYDPRQGFTVSLRFYQWRLTQAELVRELELNGFRALQVAPIHKRVGLRRMVFHDLGLNPRSLPGKAAQVLLYPLVSKTEVAHMLFAAAQKR
jgi:SAM-dependent methyltransferase